MPDVYPISDNERQARLRLEQSPFHALRRGGITIESIESSEDLVITVDDDPDGIMLALDSESERDAPSQA